jgi:hypothetical protein
LSFADGAGGCQVQTPMFHTSTESGTIWCPKVEDQSRSLGWLIWNAPPSARRASRAATTPANEESLVQTRMPSSISVGPG